MKKFKITYRSRFGTHRVERVEFFEAYSSNDALWHAYKVAATLLWNAEVREVQEG